MTSHPTPFKTAANLFAVIVLFETIVIAMMTVYLTFGHFDYDARMRARGVCEFRGGKVIGDDPHDNWKVICIQPGAFLP